MITAADLAGMRGTLEDTMPEALIVMRLTRTPDTSMGYTETWVDQPLTTCRMAPLAGGVGSAMAEALIQGRIGTSEAWIFSAPAETDIRDTDRVSVNGDEYFEVAIVLEPRTWEISRRFVAVKLA